LAALGVPSVQAPSEGEAQAAMMAARGTVWAAASEDYDSLLFGAPRLVRGLAARGRAGQSPGAQLVDREELLNHLGVNGDELILIGILVGTDFNEGAKGFGPKRALKLVQEHLGWEETLKKAGLDPKEVVPVAELFRHPAVVEATLPSFGPVDEATVERILVTGHDFSPERVRAAIARARKRPVVAGSPSEARGRQTLLETYGGQNS
jgi:flap endonuclease-1